MKKNKGLMASIAILILAVLLAGCSAPQPSKPAATPSGTAAQSTAAPTVSVSVAPSVAPSVSKEAAPAALTKDQLKSLEQPLTGLLLTTLETGSDYPDAGAAVDPQFAEYYLYYMANNFYDQNAKTVPGYKDAAFSEFIPFTGADADKLLYTVFGKRFSSKNLPAFDPKSEGNTAFIESGTVYVGASPGGPSTVTYAGGDVALKNGSADVQYQYYYVPMTHGLEYNGTLNTTITPDNAGVPVISTLTIPPLAEDTASAS